MLAGVQEHDKQTVYASLMAFCLGDDNDVAIACMISSWQSGNTVLPANAGLSPQAFIEMLGFHFPGYDHTMLVQPDEPVKTSRTDELEDVKNLLLGYRSSKQVSAAWLADILAIACHGQDHLWQDLGLWSRKDLSDLMARNYPELAKKNDKNMKWKKFIYKQLCITEGIYTCRSPSCEACLEYSDCFGPED